MSFSTDVQHTVAKVVLVTGGCGYIGSHTIVSLINAGFDVVCIDNLCNSNSVALDRIRQITNCSPDKLKFFNQDICDCSGLRAVFSQCPRFYACIHFAGLKAVGESTKIPLRYYVNNVIGSMVLLRQLEIFGCRIIVFSSSATVYGSSISPLTEKSQAGVGITNSYGNTKYFIEEILHDFVNSPESRQSLNEPFKCVVLRYFNPVGAHPSGLIGEDPNGIPNNLMPFISQVAVGRRPKLTVFGNDYDTPDGSGVRDYIHVMDIADGHVKALNFLDRPSEENYHVFNLGSGSGTSVLELISAFARASNQPIPFEIGPRRSGDLSTVLADPCLAREVLGWTAVRGIDEICRDGWMWQSNNPNGYASISSNVK